MNNRERIRNTKGLMEQHLFPLLFQHEVSKYFSLNGEQLLKLRNEVEASSGHVLSLMHPLNMPPAKHERFADYFEVIISRKFKNYLHKTANPNKKIVDTPVFVFYSITERDAYYRYFQYRVDTFCERMEKAIKQRHGKSVKFSRKLSDYNIYLAPTEYDKGEPHIPNAQEMNDIFYDRSKSSAHFMDSPWVALINIFRYLQIQSITASGGYIGKGKGKEFMIDRCLGSFVDIMRHSFRVDISNSAVYKDKLSRESIAKKGVKGKDI
jgi:hypothetical protein